MNDALRDKHFQDLSRIVERHTGIQCPPSKRTMIEGRLRKRVRALGLDGLETYGTRLFDGEILKEEFPFLVDCMTTNKTDFFREPDHFEFLRQHAVPALLKGATRAGSNLKLWSAACSMGAEAYTMAMVLADMHEGRTGMNYSVLGTDICSTVLDQARRAIYPSAMLDAVPSDLRRRYAMPARDAARDEARIVPELRRRARFMQMNLMDASYPVDRDVDVIFCRNVLIYFSRPVQQGVLIRLCSHLRPGGYLVLGHSESFALEDKSTMVQVMPTVFQRVKDHANKRAA